MDLYTYANGDTINNWDPDGRFASAAYEKVSPTIINTLNDPRFQGGMRAAGGFVEAKVGLAAMPLNPALGGLLIFNGVDNFTAGLSQAISANYHDPLTVQLLEKAGFSHGTSYMIHDLFGGLGTMGGAKLIQGYQAATSTLKFPKELLDLAAYSSRQSVLLREHLRQLEKYGEAGYKTLNNGKVRYYGEIIKANKPGEMIGRRMVREWNSENNLFRNWHETLDAKGNIRIVRPQKVDNVKDHYNFNENGFFTEGW
jgi:hypothetical protein